MVGVSETGRMTPEQIRSVRETGTDLEGMVADLASEPKVLLAYLFGSVALGRADRLSDVDVAVLMDWECDDQERFDTRLDLMRRLARFSSRSVDVIALNDADPILAHEVVGQGVLLFCRNEEALVSFSSRTYRLYFDYKPVLEWYTRNLSEDLHTGGLLGRRRRGEAALAALRELHRRTRADAPGDA